MVRQKVEIGEIVHEHLMFDSTMASRETYEGKVIYIHPKGRFFRAEFKLPGGVVREAFPLGDRGADGVTVRSEEQRERDREHKREYQRRKREEQAANAKLIGWKRYWAVKRGEDL